MRQFIFLVACLLVTACGVNIQVNDQPNIADSHSYHITKESTNITIRDGPISCFSCINGPGSVIYYGGEAICFVGVGTMGVNLVGAYRIWAADRWIKITLSDLHAVTVQPGWVYWFNSPHTIIKVDRWQ